MLRCATVEKSAPAGRRRTSLLILFIIWMASFISLVHSEAYRMMRLARMTLAQATGPGPSVIRHAL